MKNWKTTTIGILTAIVAVATGGKEYLSSGELPDLGLIVASLMAAWGLIVAKDGTARL